ncbi:MAG: amino acid adenylation domain-containing protein [Proteobacteria bacterium]|nr:amino acid adenylation domain-containing protein [Pseudomonadota bacterium]
MIVDIYRLSPMQEAMLSSALRTPESSAYFNQLSCHLTGDLRPDLLKDSWRYLVARHPVLRASFHWEELESPVSVVHDTVDLPWCELDWRDMGESERIERWAELIRTDRERGFRIDRPPLMRCQLIHWEQCTYRFVWSHHHLLLDGWCLGLIVEELFQVYQSLRDGVEPRLQSVRPYREFILWLQKQSQGDAEAFWRQELDGLGSPTTLNMAGVAAHVSRHAPNAYQELRVELSAAQSGALTELARHSRITPNTVVLGAWALLLRRYTGQTDIVFGTTVSGRPPELSGVERMLGVFINSVPSRIAVDDKRPLVPWLQDIHLEHAERERHGHTALNDIRRYSQIGNDQPLFESLVIFMNYPLDVSATQSLGDVTVDHVRIFDQTDLPLTVQVVPGDRWSVELIYDSGRFEAGAMNRLVGHLKELLHGFAATPQAPLASFNMITAAERARVMGVWNRTEAPIERDRLVIDRFEERVAQHPGRTAVIHDGIRWTYQQLNSTAVRLAGALRRIGSLGADDLVAIASRRSEKMLAAILAIWKCGSAYVPVDPSDPDDRIVDLMRTSGARAVLTQAGQLSTRAADRIADFAPVLDVDVVLDQGIDESEPVRQLMPHHLAYVIYTSGSTGKPKGAMVEQLGMLNHMLAKIEDLELDECSVIAQNASHCFDISVWQFICALLTGGTTAIYGGDLILRPDAMIDRVQAQGITVVEVVPSYLSVLLDRMPPHATFSTLRTLIVTGETVHPALVRRWFDRFPTIPMVNAYGPTEASDDITHFTMSRPPDLPTIPVGKAIRNTHIYIVDEYMNLCAEGIKGEICVSGIGVGRGYINDAARTGAVFTEDPFREESGVRLYKTGDVGCFMADGTVLFFGRKDHQVKIRGFRIELGEIEGALTALPEVVDAIVIDRRDDGRSPYLCAYITGSGEAPPDPAVIATELARTLPEYMIPAAFVFLDALPLSRNGKVDRKALPRPDFAQLNAPSGDSRSGEERQATPREAALISIWQDVLNVTPIGVNDNFFALGGDSILVMRIASRAAQANIGVTPRMVFEHPTIAELAQVASWVPEGADIQQPVAGVAALTPIQRRFFSHHRLDLHHYNQSIALDLPHNLDPVLLGRALDHIVAHHDVLRAVFRRQNGDEKWENRAAAESISLRFDDISQREEAQQVDHIARVSTEAQASLNLVDGPLLQACLFGRGPGRPARLLLVIHHLVVDGYSWRILIDDLRDAYTQLGEKGDVVLPDKGTSYLDWAHALDAYAQLPSSETNAEYWLGFAAHSVACLPLDHAASRAENTVSRCASITETLDRETTADLLTRALAAYGTRVDDMLLTALVITIAEWSHCDHVLIDLESHGRGDFLPGVDVTRTVGWFTAVYPVLLPVHHPNGMSDSSPLSPVRVRASAMAETMKSIKERLRAVPDHGVGHDLLRFGSTDHNIRKALSSAPQPELLFNYHGRIDDEPHRSDSWHLVMEADTGLHGPDRSPRQQREHLWDINAQVSRGQLEVVWTYGSAFHDRKTIHQLATSCLRNLRALVAHCLERDVGAYTPSDFPVAHLDQRALDALVASVSPAGQSAFKAHISDVYELSPVQQGMLFHALYAPDSRVYVNQLTCRLRGDLDEQAFAGAWAHLIAHHPVLRTSFHWQGLDSPVQVVHRTAPFRLEIRDWRDMTGPDRTRQWTATALEQRDRGFCLTEPSPMRILLIRETTREYRLLWTRHHLVVDGWSSALLLQELFAAYRALAAGDAISAPVVQPYRNYVRWLQRQDTAAARTFWRDRLRGFTTATPLPGAQPDTGRVPDMAEVTTTVSRQLSRRLTSFARTQSLTLNTLVQAAWSILLSRYSGESDVVHGAISSGREPDLAGADHMIGVFINTLPVRARVDGEAAIVPWLQGFQSHLTDRERHAHSSLTDVTAWSDVKAGSPLFDSIVIFENYPVDATPLAKNSSLRAADIEAYDPNNYSLTLVASPGEAIDLKLMYDRNRFEPQAMSRILGHFATLLCTIAGPAQTLGQLSLLSDKERKELLTAWQHRDIPLPKGDSVITRFERQAAAHPDRPALVFESRTLSYADLNAMANQLARRLQERTPLAGDDLIAIIAPRSDRLAAAILAVWKCGAAYLPIDPAFPARRVQQMVVSARPTMIVVDRTGMAPQVVAAVRSMAEIAFLDDLMDQSNCAVFSNPGLVPAAESLAYVIYTSGSTGTPKGVMVEHRGMLNHINSMIEDMGLDSHSRVGQTASHCFDISVWQFFAALLVGGTTIIYPDHWLFEPGRFVERLQKDRVTALQFVPSYLSVLVDKLTHSDTTVQLPDLDVVASIGEELVPALARRWFQLFPTIRLINTYGPTEASDSVTHFIMDGYRDGETIPIGRPIRNMRVYVLDPSGNPCPVGVKGELCIAGIGVGRGYLHDPARTAQVFATDPFAGDPAARMYRTGDIASYTADGDFLFFGRADQQVKIRGHRIELGEIEHHLSSLPNIREAVVLARQNGDQGRSLCAYVTLKQNGKSKNASSNQADSKADVSAIKSALAARLPVYMVPDAVMVLAAMPRLPNRKIDRKALPEPAPELARAGHAGTATRRIELAAPTSETEYTLITCWQDVLGVASVAPSDSFFELGGHSLKAIQLVSRIQRELDVSLHVSDLFVHDTVRQLAAHIERSKSAATPPISRATPAPDYPASHAQKRIWLACRDRRSSVAYHITGAYWLEGDLDTESVHKAFDVLFDRHESLRTRLFVRGGDLRQRIQTMETTDIPLHESCLSGAPHPEKEAVELAADDARTPFDLTGDLLLRINLMRVAKQKHLLSCTMHHILADAWSLEILIREFLEVYRAHNTGRDNRLSPLAIQYKDYAVWHNAVLDSVEMDQHRAYWHKTLAGPAPRFDALLDAPRDQRKGVAGNATLSIPADLYAQLDKVAMNRRVSLYTVLLSAIYALLYRYSDQDDIAIGTQVAGRDHPDLEDQIGCYVNTLVVRAHPTGQTTIGTLIDQVGRTLRQAWSHQVYPFDRLVEEMQAGQDCHRRPFFDVQVDFVPAVDRALLQGESGLTVCPIELDDDGTKFDMSFQIEDLADHLMINIVYDIGLYRAVTAQGLCDSLAVLLREFVTNQDRALGELRLTNGPNGDNPLRDATLQDETVPDKVAQDKTIVDISIDLNL